MATIAVLRAQIKALLDAGLADESVTVYATAPGVPPPPPAIVVAPRSAVYDDMTNRLGLDRYDFDLQIMVPIADPAAAQEALDEFLVDEGPNSIRQIITENRELGLDDGTDARIESMTYGVQFGPGSDLQHLGASLRLAVFTTG